MNINLVGRYMQTDGYGRFTSRLARALMQEGVQVKVATKDSLSMPEWMKRLDGFDSDALTISCVMPEEVQPLDGRQWLFTMLEGSVLPAEWAGLINVSGVERIIVPCEENALSFRKAGVLAPVHVVPGGIDPLEFPYASRYRSIDSINRFNPYTFLVLADRGNRKGWEEAREAFYVAFGGKTTGDQCVRLIVKSRPQNRPTTIGFMMRARERDRRVVYQVSDVPKMQSVYEQVDMVLLPSRFEGWGLPHREAASMGLPVVTQKYSGLDDGYTEHWSIPLTQGRIVPMPKEMKPHLGEWMVADVKEMAQIMRWARYSPETAAAVGGRASRWLKENQTWSHTAKRLIELMESEHALPVERTTLPLFV